MKLAKRISLTIILVPICILLAWYVIGFLPYVNDLKSISDMGKLDISLVEERAYEIALCAETAAEMRTQVTRNAYRSMGLKDESQRMLYWHLNTAFWYFASYLNFSDKEIFYIWSKRAWFGHSAGLAEAAYSYFNKPLNQLSDAELASLFAMANAPGLYKLGSDRLQNRVSNILRQVSHKNAN